MTALRAGLNFFKMWGGHIIWRNCLMLAEQLVYGRRSRVKYIIFKDLYNIKMRFLKEKISLDSAVIITE